VVGICVGSDVGWPLVTVTVPSVLIGAVSSAANVLPANRNISAVAMGKVIWRFTLRFRWRVEWCEFFKGRIFNIASVRNTAT
jgi:hypothetical protein